MHATKSRLSVLCTSPETMSDMYGFWTCGVYGLPVRFGTAGEHCCDDANILQRAIKKSHHKIHVITPLSSLRQGGHGRVSATGTATELPGSFVLFKVWTKGCRENAYPKHLLTSTAQVSYLAYRHTARATDGRAFGIWEPVCEQSHCLSSGSEGYDGAA